MNKKPQLMQNAFLHHQMHRSYRWCIVIICAMLAIVSYTFCAAAANLYVAPITEELNIKRFLFTIYTSVRGLTIFIVGAVFGWLKLRFKLKTLVLCGCGFSVLAFSVYSVSSSLWMFYLGGLFSGIGFVLAGSAPISIIITNWFKMRQGTILGAVYAASGFGGILLNPFLGYLYNRYSWRVGFLSVAIASISIFLLVLIFLRTSPEVEFPLKTAALTIPGAHRDWFQRCRRKSAFWVLIIINFGFGFGIGVSYAIIAPQFLSAGFSILLVSGILLTTLSLSNSCGKVLLGWICDRFGVKHMNLFGFIAGIVGLMTISLVNRPLLTPAIISVVCIGFGVGMCTVSVPIMVARFYVKEDYATMLGACMSIQMFGSAIGTPLGNLIFDRWGSYFFAFFLHLIFEIAGFVLSIHLLRQGLKGR